MRLVRHIAYNHLLIIGIRRKYRRVRIARELSPCFGNRTIDIRKPDELSVYFRDSAITSSVILYEQDGHYQTSTDA
jgi:hypothetical protein